MLIECPECKQQISDQAQACPHCGHPIKRARPVAAETPKAPHKKGHGCLIVLGIVVILGIIGSLTPWQTQGTGPHGEGCHTDWTKCADNADLVNNYEGWANVQAECKDAAAQQARFGTPKWPWFAFGSFYPGSNYVDSGIAIAVENDAQFSNAFGGMVHEKVICWYNLRRKSITNVEILTK
jgi:hypothetical protein